MRAAQVERLTEADWQVFARVRLRALAETLGEGDPQYRQEAAFSAGQWRRRLREHAQFAALLRNQPVGIVAAHQQSRETVYLYSLWLDPAARGHGLAHALVAAVLDWARERHAHTVTLRVAADNAVARGVYASLGFRPASAQDGAGELAMSLSVR